MTRADGHDAQAQTTWIWDAAYQLYYSPESGMYAYPDQATGQWHYVPASSIASTNTASEAAAQPDYDPRGEKEEGEIEDDVGWGGLMEPEQLDRALKAKAKAPGSTAGHVFHSGHSRPVHAAEKHPAYGGGGGSSSTYTSSAVSRPLRSPTPPPSTKETPKHLLRLVVLSSPSLTEGQVAIIDAREGGIQLGRDRCEKGGHPRVRVREMEVSKSHAVVYWDQGQDDGEGEGWFVVDLGSTHGTFVTPPVADGESSSGDTKAKRLSEPKLSSLPHPLTHLSILSLGKTRFEVHLHPSWPCEQCQLSGKGNEIPIDTGESTTAASDQSTLPAQQGQGGGYAMNSSEKRGNREINRKREMAALKDSLLNRNSANAQQAAREDQQQPNRYIDRSAIRRQMHPRSPPPRSAAAAAAAPAHEEADRTPAGVSAFAQNMLAAQGWAPGSGLGRDQSGRSEAIEVRMRVEKRGLGATGAEAPTPNGDGSDDDWRKRAKMRRFQELR